MKLHRRKHGCSIGEIRIDPQHASRVSCRRLIDFSQRKALFFQSQIEYGDSSPGNEEPDHEAGWAFKLSLLKIAKSQNLDFTKTLA